MISLPSSPEKAAPATPPAAKPGPAPAAPTALSISGLNAWFGSHHALKNISLEIPDRAVTAIIGPSGCGKSTLIRCLNRMHETVPSARAAGRITLHGEDLYAKNADPVLLRRRIGMVFQKANPFPTMTIFDNVAAGLRLNGVKKKSIVEEVVERSLRGAALWDEVKDKLHGAGTGLSGGQQQRLCIARALAVEPEVLLLDEPCSALDPISTAKVEELILTLNGRLTIVIVTHNMQQAARVSTKTAFFLTGELIEFDETSKIFTNPAKKQTEDYITGEVRMSPATHSHFDEDLKTLKEKILYMGQTALDMVDKARRSLRDRDSDLAKAVFELENTVNQLHVEVDDRCVKLFALHQPMAIDLRFITAVMKINSDLERIGDQSVNVAQTCHYYLFNEEDVPQTDIILKMADISHKMLREAMRAFDNKDVELARAVMAQDEEEDRLKREAITALINLIRRDPPHARQFVDLILLSKNFERVGDHATNIAEDVIFMTLGKDIRHHLSEDFVLTPVRREP